MLRTNTLLLSFIESLYEKQTESNIVCRKFAKGELLYKQGETYYKVFIIKAGIAKCYHDEENGKSYTFEFFGEGEIVGEAEALRKSPCFNTVEAMSEVQFYCFPASFFNHLCDTNFQFCRILLSEMAERMINTSSWAVYQQLYPIKYALTKLLTIEKRQGLNLSKADMASYLGIDIRSLNRLLKEISDVYQ